MNYKGINLNDGWVAKMSLEAFLKTKHIRAQFAERYEGPTVDAEMTAAWNAAVAKNPPPVVANPDPAKEAVLVDFVVNQKYLDANKEATAKLGDTVKVTLAESRKYK